MDPIEEVIHLNYCIFPELCQHGVFSYQNHVQCLMIFPSSPSHCPYISINHSIEPSLLWLQIGAMTSLHMARVEGRVANSGSSFLFALVWVTIYKALAWWHMAGTNFFVHLLVHGWDRVLQWPQCVSWRWDMIDYNLRAQKMALCRVLAFLLPIKLIGGLKNRVRIVESRCQIQRSLAYKC